MIRFSHQRIGISILAAAIGLTLAATEDPVADWEFKDGAGSARASDSAAGNHGTFGDAALVQWAREDDRGSFIIIDNPQRKPGGNVIVADARELRLDRDFSIVVAFNCDLTQTNPQFPYASLLSKGDDYNQSYCLLVENTGGLVVSLEGMQPDYNYFTTKIGSHSDTVVIVTYNRQNGLLSAYCNGIPAGEAHLEGSLVQNNKPLRIGNLEHANYLFNGNFYGVQLYQRVLSSEEIATLTRKWLGNHPVTRSESTGITRSPLQIPAAPARQADGSYTFATDVSGYYDLAVSIRQETQPSGFSLQMENPKENISVRIPPCTTPRQIQITVRTGLNFNTRRNIRIVPEPNCEILAVALYPREERDLFCSELTPPSQCNESLENKLEGTNFRERRYLPERAEPAPVKPERGYLLFPVNRMELVFRNWMPESDYEHIQLAMAVTPGETEALTFGIRAMEQLSDVRIRQNGNFTGISSGNQVDIPVRVDYIESTPKRSNNFEGLDAEYMVAPQYLEPLEALTVAAGETRNFRLTFEVPDHTPPGVYKSEFTLSANGKTDQVIPVSIEVYPFALDALQNFNLGFYGCFLGLGGISVEDELRDMQKHGMNSVVLFPSGVCNVKLTGSTPEDIEIDFENSKLTQVAEGMKKLGMNGDLFFQTESIREALWEKSGHRIPLFEAMYLRVMKQLDDYAQVNGWPKLIYQSYDEVPSNPENFPMFTLEMRLLKQLNLTTEHDHLWYKTSRPLQAEIDASVDFIDIFFLRYNSKRLFYVDSWEEITAFCREKNKPLIAYNTNNGTAFAETETMRFIGGWFFQTLGRGCAGQFLWVYQWWPLGNPYNDLDGHYTDWFYIYPPYGKRKGGPSLGYETLRTGINDLRYINTLKSRIVTARKQGHQREADMAQALLDRFVAKFDFRKLQTHTAFLDSQWDRAWEENGQRFATGRLGLQSNWSFEDYDDARRQIAQAIIELDRILAPSDSSNVTPR